MTKIEWTDATWNPVVGCTAVSAGCANCYAARLSATRLRSQPQYDGLATLSAGGTPQWSGAVRLLPERLDKPLHWRKPRKIFVCDMGDLFHEDVPDKFIAEVFAIIGLASWHTFQVLTKRPERMATLLNSERFQDMIEETSCDHDGFADYCASRYGYVDVDDRRMTDWRAQDHETLPFPNLWIGCSVEDQRTADERIPHLLRCPAAVRFLSCEPLLGPTDLCRVYLGSSGFTPEPRRGWDDIKSIEFYLNALRGGPKSGIPGLDWVIVGGESGPRARPCNVEWIRSIVEQCRAAGIACFVKQLGAQIVIRNDSFSNWPREGDGLIDFDDRWMDRNTFQGDDAYVRCEHPKGADPAEWPDDLRVREFPR